jgi:hypothetical protein
MQIFYYRRARLNRWVSFAIAAIALLLGACSTIRPIGDTYAPGLRPVVLSIAYEINALRPRKYSLYTIKLQQADDPNKIAYSGFRPDSSFLGSSVKELKFRDDYEEGIVNILYLAPGRYKVSGWIVEEPYSNILQSGTRLIYSAKPLAINFDVTESGTTYLGRFTCYSPPYAVAPAQQVPCLFVISDQKNVADMALAAPFLAKNALAQEPFSRPLLAVKQLPFPFVKKAIDLP